MRQVRIHGPADVRVDAVPVPSAGPNDVVVQIKACGICGTDLAFVAGGGVAGVGVAGGVHPMPLGHEASGVIVQLGQAVQGLSEGMRVAVNPMTADAVIGNGGPEGAFCDYLLVRQAKLGRSIFPIPPGMSDAVAALVEPLSVARHGVSRMEARPGSNAVVYGAGPIGLGAVLWLARAGVNVVSIDLDADRLARAKKLGAFETIQASPSVSIPERLKQIFGPARTALDEDAVNVDSFMDAAAAPHIPDQVVRMGKHGARLVLVGVHKDKVAVDFYSLLKSEMIITASIGYPVELPMVLADLATLGEEADVLISHRYPFESFAEAFETARGGKCAKVMVEFGAPHGAL